MIHVKCIHYPAKRPQHEHVDGQVRPTGMNQPVCKKAVYLPMMFDGIGIELQSVQQYGIVKCQYGNQQSGNDNSKDNMTF